MTGFEPEPLWNQKQSVCKLGQKLSLLGKYSSRHRNADKFSKVGQKIFLTFCTMTYCLVVVAVVFVAVDGSVTRCPNGL